MSMKISKWLTTLPATLIAGMPAAQAGWWDDLICKWTGYCAPGGGGGGPVSVTEPAMITLFSASIVVAALMAARRQRRRS
jgi:hypothetical protein